jgi:hypothetical protein
LLKYNRARLLADVCRKKPDQPGYHHLDPQDEYLWITTSEGIPVSPQAKNASAET